MILVIVDLELTFNFKISSNSFVLSVVAFNLSLSNFSWFNSLVRVFILSLNWLFLSKNSSFDKPPWILNSNILSFLVYRLLISFSLDDISSSIPVSISKFL